MAASRRFGGPGPSVTIILGMLSAPASAAPELEGCYVGALPCGTPARMSGLVAQCLAKPALCGTLGGSPLVPAGSVANAPPARIATAPRNTGRGIAGGPPASPPPTPEPVAAR